MTVEGATMPMTTKMTKISATLDFASLSCSRYTDSLTSLPSHPLAAYISHNNAVILSTSESSPTVTSVIPIRQSPLNAIHFLSLNDTPLLLTACSDGYISICIQDIESTTKQSFILLESFKVHDDSCITFDTLALNSENQIFVTSISETSLITTIINDPISNPKISTSCTHLIPSSSFLPQTVSIHQHTPENIFIALAGTNRIIQLFQSSFKNTEIRPLVKIPAHRDWIRCLAWSVYEDDYPLLASASSDSCIKVWHISPMKPGQPPQPLHLQFDNWAVRHIALFDEHEKSVQCVRFQNNLLLSASMDGTVAVWDIKSMTLSARFGLLGGHSIHATGFFSASFIYEGNNKTVTIMAGGFSGAIQRWRKANGSDEEFVALPAVGGHVAPVRQVTWSPDGYFLLSASDDKSVRAFVDVGDERLVERARPQVHGHSISSIAFCNSQASRYVSTAEERMLRVFDAPDSFRAGKRKYTGVTSAKLPELGLSNKAVFAEEEDDDDDDYDTDEDEGQNENENVGKVDDMKVVMMGSSRGNSEIPLEEELKQETLWPETAKLYGHGNEVVRVTADAKSGLIASACRAQRERDAEIILWNGGTGVEICRLRVHELTVTDLKFSDDGNRLVSVSRDRSVGVCVKSSDDNKWNIIGKVEGAHARGVYCCGFMTDERFIITGGRDKWIRVWEINVDNKSLKEIGGMKMEKGVTAVDCMKKKQNDDVYVIAVGLERGDFCIIESCIISMKAEMKVRFRGGDRMRCGERVTCVQWRPKAEEQSLPQLAISSEDMSVRLLSIRL